MQAMSSTRNNTMENQTSLEEEHAYLMTERLGLLCGTDTPTPEQELVARTEADAAVATLNPPRTRE